MYCKKCGKYVAGRRDLCEDCEKNNEPTRPSIVFKGTPATGIWQSLVAFALIAGSLGFLIGGNALYVYACVTCEAVDGKVLDIFIQTFMKLASDAKTLVAVSILLAIVGIVFSIGAVRTVQTARINKYVFPTATLITGIIALIASITLIIIGVTTFGNLPYF